MAIGTVKFLNLGDNSAEAAGASVLSEGQRISFDTLADVKGAKAVNLRAV